MSSKIKIINGSEHVFSIEEAAKRLRGLGCRITGISPVLSVPYEIEYPFSAGARSPDSSMVLEVKGTRYDLMCLERAVN